MSDYTESLLEDIQKLGETRGFILWKTSDLFSYDIGMIPHSRFFEQHGIKNPGEILEEAEKFVEDLNGMEEVEVNEHYKGPKGHYEISMEYEGESIKIRSSKFWDEEMI